MNNSRKPRLHKWAVSVYVEGERILTIADDAICGKAEFTEKEEEIIREAANNLLGFIGEES